MANSKKLGGKLIFNLLMYGLMGQMAWAVENQFFNTFLFNEIGGNSADISHMVAASSVVAVVTTLIMGTLSDKLGKRKLFLCGGYIFWGIIVMAFAFISRENIASIFGLTDETRIRLFAVNTVIIMDCIMTFMGSTCNDAAFNAWVTDITCDENRASTESILSIVGIVAMVAVTVAFPLAAEAIGYSVSFIGLGAIVTAAGIIGIFTVKDSGDGIKKDSSFIKDITYGFRPSVVKEHRSLYLALVAIGIYSISTNVFFPYIFIYLQHYLGFSFDTLFASLTLPIIIAAAVAVIGVCAAVIFLGKLIDKYGKSFFVFPTIIFYVVGLCLAFFTRRLVTFALAAIPVLAGYGLLMIILGAAVRDFTPEDKVGQFQGIRMIFFVLLPMVIGPAIGNAVINNFPDGTYTNDYQEIVNIPVPGLFLAAGAVAVFILFPAIALRKTWKAKEKALKESNKE